MLLTCEGFTKTYEIESLARMLSPGLTLKGTGEDGRLLARMEPAANGGIRLVARAGRGGQSEERSDTVDGALSEKERVLALALLLFEAHGALTGRTPRWGVLTGIRPIKLYHAALDRGLGDEEIVERMAGRYAVSREMSRLALRVARCEREIHRLSRPRGFSLYVSIPFCPSRCSYCSFVSQSVEREGALIAPYVELLGRELAGLGALSRSLGLELQTIYFGGGTPTVLTPRQLTALFETVAASFDLSDLLEYTVEAGRPDTIDRSRLTALRRAGVGRLSVNPQSMDDAVLAAVGRRHTAADVERAAALARETGFDSINMDLIAGLPGDTAPGFLASVDRVLSLRPDNLTVHSLTLKRASALASGGEAAALHERADEVAGMVDGARERVLSAGYRPYYLYRQKSAVGSLDNTGYALPGKEGIYNVFIMDETQTVLAAGAGGVTKLRAPGGKIERVFNLKLPYEYIRQYEQTGIQRERIQRFYEGHSPQQKLLD